MRAIVDKSDGKVSIRLDGRFDFSAHRDFRESYSAGLEAADVRVEGVHISTAYLPDRPGAQNAAFVRAYRQAYKDQLPDHRGAAAYDIVHLLARAVAAVGSDRTRIRDYLAGVGTTTPAFDGVTGRIAFDENGDVPDKDVVIGVVRDKRLVTASGR